MTEDQKLGYEQEVRRAELAKQVMNNPVYQEAFLRIKADLLSGFENSGAKQDSERKEIWMMLQLVNKLEGEMQQVMETGELAKKTLMQKVFKR